MNKISVAFFGLVAASLITTIGFGIFIPMARGGDVATNIGVMPVFFLITLLVSLVVGGPLIYLFDKLKLINAITATLGGGVVGGLGSLVMRMPNTPGATELCQFTLVGLLAGFVFWSVWYANEKITIS